MPEDAGSWQLLVDQFSKLVAGEIADAELFECDFSTSTQVEQTAGRVVLLEAYSPYFSLCLISICDIPSITLTGTVEDWRKIRDRVDHLEKFGLRKWCRSLRPITDQFVRAASGTVDLAFWKRIYNPADAYGGQVINGWIPRLYPYLRAAMAPKTSPIRCWTCRWTSRRTTRPGRRALSAAASRPRCPQRPFISRTRTTTQSHCTRAWSGSRRTTMARCVPSRAGTSRPPPRRWTTWPTA
ncbi:DUF4419 domain-containing protein [Kibdelosporangium philippinense]|uniref:DUF4419 domain-containing protein n=1 Tax=Kibdelosporangium philippinense TaxID=211113 RepID=UPI00361BAE37